MGLCDLGCVSDSARLRGQGFGVKVLGSRVQGRGPFGAGPELGFGVITHGLTSLLGVGVGGSVELV